MKKQTLSIGALAVAGAAFAVVPVFAQTPTATTEGRGMMRGNFQEQGARGQGMLGMMNRGGGIGMTRPAAIGTVTAISGNTITLSGNTDFREASSTSKTIFTINAANATVIKNQATSTVSSIIVGDKLAVQGTTNGTTITATIIHDDVMPRGGMMSRGGEGMMNGSSSLSQLQGNGQPVIAGSITAINGNTVTITNKSNVAYTIDVTKAKVTIKNVAGTASSLTIGDQIFAQGTINGTSVVAATVIDNGAYAAQNIPPTGTVQTNTPGQGMMGGRDGFFGGITHFFSRMFGF